MKRPIVLLVALAVLVAACGGGDDAGAEATETTISTTASPSTTTTEATTTTTTAAPTTTTTEATTTTIDLEEMGIVPGLDPDVDAIALAYQVAFASETTYEEKAPYVVEPEGLEETVEAYMATGTAMGGVLVVVKDVVISGDIAEVSYDLLLNGAPTYPDLTGDAVLTEDGWKLSRAMFCGLMSLARSACPEA